MVQNALFRCFHSLQVCIRKMRIYKGSDFTMLDVEINIKSETQGRFAGDLTIGKTIWGFLAARVKESMTPMDNGGEIRNSRGGLGEDEVIWEEAEWMDISGPATSQEWNGLCGRLRTLQNLYI